MPRKYYDLLVNRNYAVKRRYEQFVLSHPSLHRRCRAASWGYLLWLNLKFNLLHLPDRRRIRTGNESGTGCSSAAEIAARLCRAEVVSFDIFDTLVLRPFAQPTDLFYLVGEQLGIPDFRSIRIRAEQTARERSVAAGGHGDVNLDAIYAVLAGELSIDAAQGAAIEAQTEISTCMPSPFLQEVWQAVRAAGKRMVITTDMYLPEETLRAMLEKCGFTGYEHLFLSNVHGCGKYDGRLFEIVRRTCGAASYSHIGDNRNADVQQARAAGFDAVHVPNCNALGSDFRPERMSFLTRSAYAGIVNRRLYCGAPCSPAYEYGYKCGGILMLGFCEFIHEYAERTGVDKVLFFARDGYIMKQIYEERFPGESTAYVLWSRAAAAKLCAALYPQDYFRRFLDQKTGRGIPLREILASMGLAGMELPFSPDTPLTEGNLPAVREALRTRMEEIQTHYAGMHRRAADYYGEILDGCERVITVDCGWAGSGSILFEAYAQRVLGRSVQVTGLLAGSNSYNQVDSDFSESYFRTGKLRAYCFSAEHNRDHFEAHFPAKKHNIYFELLCGAPEPSFLGFDENGPVFDSESENAAMIREIHAGERDFVRDYCEAFAAFPYMQRISGSDACAPFYASIAGKGAYAAAVFRDCIFDETTGGRKEKLG